jgi:nitrite reductase/ring-hydroxylating ferredoxin subunit
MTEAGVWIATIEARSLPAGQMAGVEAGDQRIALYNVEGTFYATANVCTHAFALLSDGWLEGDTVECPLHGGQFNVCTGKAGGDPVDIDLATFPVRIANGVLEVFLPG